MTQPNAPAPGADPSMDEILASIRKILNEDDAKAAPLPEPDHAGPQPAGTRPPDVLILDETMLVAPEPTPEPPRQPAPAQAAAPEVPGPEPHPAPAPVSAPAPAMVMETALPTPPLVPLPPATPIATPLVSPAAAGAAGASVESLMRTLARERSTATHRGGPTIEDLVREEMRPMLKHWLDTHLPPLVERLVRAEIERVVNRMAP